LNALSINVIKFVPKSDASRFLAAPTSPWLLSHRMLTSRLLSRTLTTNRKTSNLRRQKGYTLRPLANFKTIGSSSMLKWLVRLFIVMILGAVLGVASLIGIYFYIKPQLPDVTALRDVKLATPMKVYSRD